MSDFTQEELQSAAVTFYQKNYPHGIPADLIPDRPPQLIFGSKDAKLAMLVDFSWSESPWAEPQGELLEAIITKGLKRDIKDVQVIKNPITASNAEMVICFGAEPLDFLDEGQNFSAQINKKIKLGSQDILVTSSLDNMLKSVEAKKSFWKVLQQYV